MNKLYKINITIFNDHGELLDTQRAFATMDELNAFMTNETTQHALWNEAKTNGENDGLLYEELYESKEDAEFGLEDTYDGSSKIDLINSDEKFI